MKRWLVATALVLATVLAAGTTLAQEPHSGTVIETFEAGGYTYVRLKTEQGEIWLAGPRTTISTGERLECGPGMLVAEFHSPTLKRTFEKIWFVGRFKEKAPDGQDSASRLANSPHGSKQPPVGKPKAGTIPRAGASVAELWRDSARYSGSEITVRGIVTKVNARIMGKNWVHLMDGTGEKGKDEIVVTTGAEVQAGDRVLARGKVGTNVDFGSGYHFAVILQDAELTVEPTEAR